MSTPILESAIAKFANAADGITAYVWPCDKGGYNVTLRDDDAGEFVPVSLRGVADLDAAKSHAKRMIGDIIPVGSFVSVAV